MARARSTPAAEKVGDRPGIDRPIRPCTATDPGDRDADGVPLLIDFGDDPYVPRPRPRRLRSREQIAADALDRRHFAEFEREAIVEQTAGDPEQEAIRMRWMAECHFHAEACDAEELAALDRLDRTEGTA